MFLFNCNYAILYYNIISYSPRQALIAPAVVYFYCLAPDATDVLFLRVLYRICNPILLSIMIFNPTTLTLLQVFYCVLRVVKQSLSSSAIPFLYSGYRFNIIICALLRYKIED